MTGTGEHPTLLETATGVFLHDIGKFLQRAYGSSRHLAPEVKARESIILPVHQSRYSHWHALWSEQFFHWLETRNLSFPRGMNLGRVRDVAVFHHEPAGARRTIGGVGFLAAEADRLSAGMDRKPLDESEEAAAESQGRDRYIKTALRSPFGAVDIGLGTPAGGSIPLARLEPGEGLFPRDAAAADDNPARYAKLWESFQADCAAVFELDHTEIFCEALLSLSERYLFAVPSSTKDQPDVSLHDHSRSAAALAAALYRWHEQEGSLDAEDRIRDRKAEKFRIVTGDLSGIQSSLFLLANQRVRGVNRILRARSFLLGMLVEGTILRCRQELRLPVFSVLQNVGGRFLILAANTPETEEAVGRVRNELEGWLYRRYLGELALNLAVTGPISGEDLLEGRLPRVLAEISRTVEAAKLRPFSTCLEAIHRGADYRTGRTCSACGVRPATRTSPGDDGETTDRCDACEDEARLGGDLPKASFLGWSNSPGAEGTHLELFSGLRLHWFAAAPFSLTPFLSVVRLYRGGATATGPLPLRFMANHVPRFEPGEPAHPRYAGLEQGETDGLKTFEHLARDAWTPTDAGFEGEDHLAVVKADVDRLGLVFGGGLKKPSLGAFASLSRMMDFFFTGQLYDLLEREFRSTYTVYAGGDDLLLISPWRQAVDLAARLREQFGRWTCGNPNVTLSAGVELIKTNQPLNRAVREAEERLECAKAEGRNRISAVDRGSMTWKDYAEQVKRGKWLSELIRKGELSHGFVYQILYFAGERLRAETGAGAAGGRRELDLSAANWRARWGYQLARHVDRQKQKDVLEFVSRLLGLDGELRPAGAFAPPRTAITLALYSVRKSQERR